MICADDHSIFLHNKTFDGKPELCDGDVIIIVLNQKHVVAACVEFGVVVEYAGTSFAMSGLSDNTPFFHLLGYLPPKPPATVLAIKLWTLSRVT
jgi:hypothetical protein